MSGGRPGALFQKGASSGRHVSGRVLLLRELRHGMSRARSDQARPSADESGKIRAGAPRRIAAGSRCADKTAI